MCVCVLHRACQLYVKPHIYTYTVDVYADCLKTKQRLMAISLFFVGCWSPLNLKVNLSGSCFCGMVHSMIETESNQFNAFVNRTRFITYIRRVRCHGKLFH